MGPKRRSSSTEEGDGVGGEDFGGQVWMGGDVDGACGHSAVAEVVIEAVWEAKYANSQSISGDNKAVLSPRR